MVPQGGTVLLVPHPADGFVFQGFGGNVCNGSQVQGSNDCNVTISGPITIQVTFTQVASPPPSKVTLNVNRTGNGVCTVFGPADSGINCGTSCTADFDVGQSVTLVAVPDAHSAFTGWKGGACDGSKDPTCTVTMDKNITLSARCMAITCSVDP
jgi:hypothetical protein